MEIAIVAATFPPETIVAGRMASDLAIYLSSIGHEVRVICPYPTRPLGTAYKTLTNQGSVTSGVEQGTPVTRVPSFTAPEYGLWRRVRESWSFGHWAARTLGSPGSPPAVVYESAWPMLAQAWVGLTSARMGIPYVTTIMDIYPESAFAKVPKWFGAMCGKPLLYLDRMNAARASKVVVISERMREIYQRTRHVPSNKIEVVRTWQDERPFVHLPRREAAGMRYRIRTDLFTFVYLGNIGPVAGVEHLIRSFGVAALHDAQLLIIGQGSHREACVRLAKETHSNIHFPMDPEVSNVPLLQSLGDVCLLPMRRGEAFSSIPSKLSAYMLSGKPVLASVDSKSDSALLIEEADCGWVVEPEDVESFSQTMRELRKVPASTLEATGARGRIYALEHLSRVRGVERLATVILQAAEQSAQPPTLHTGASESARAS